MAEKKRRTPLSPASLALLAVTLGLAVAGGLSLVFAPRSPPAPAALPSGFDLQAHQGGAGLAPANSWAAAEKSLASGVSTLHFGLAPGPDGGTGGLAGLLARSEARTAGAIRYNLEILSFPDAPAPEAWARAAVAAVRAAGVAGRASVASLDWRVLRAVQRIAPEIATLYMTSERPGRDTLERGRPGASPWTAGFDLDDQAGSVVRLVQAAGGAAWAPDYRDLRPADLEEAQRRGLPVVAWTVNEAADMASLLERGVAGIMTDHPDRLRAVLAGRGLPLPPAFAP